MNDIEEALQWADKGCKCCTVGDCARKYRKTLAKAYREAEARIKELTEITENCCEKNVKQLLVYESRIAALEMSLRQFVSHKDELLCGSKLSELFKALLEEHDAVPITWDNTHQTMKHNKVWKLVYALRKETGL